MSAEVNGVKVPFIPPGGVDALRRPSSSIPLPEIKKPFDEVLGEELINLKFSNHARKRLELRNINLSSEDMKLLNEAILRAESKNTREVLVLLKDIAFIVNVQNRTVITAMDEESIREHIFTNIDGAVVIR
jgi:flagellar operon protein